MNIKKIILSLAALAAGTFASATTLDFSDQNNLGVSFVSGSFTWSGTGGGHIFAEQYFDDDTLAFDSVVTVTSMQLNAAPYENYGFPNGETVLVDFELFDSNWNSLWFQTIDLTSFTSWSNWLTVNINVANVKYLRDYSPANTHGTGFWPSIDNIVINETGPSVPDSGSTSLLLLATLAGFAAFKRSRQAA